MGVKERREREREELRQEILDAAREMFAREGYQSVSMRKIADKIEYSPTTIYLYFKDKTDLLNELCEEAFGKLLENIQAISEDAPDSLEFLRRGLRAYIEFGLSHPSHYEVAFITPIMEYVGQKEHPFEGSMGERAFSYLRESVRNCIVDGKLKDGDLETMSQALWAAVHGATSLMIAHRDFPFVEKDKLIDCVIETMIKGFQA